MMPDTWYDQYKKLFKGKRFPLAFVDLKAFDRNVAYVAETQANNAKTIRVASKSIRCIDLIRRVFEKGGDAYKGILAFTMEEAAFLYENGFDDIVVAYPAVRSYDLDLLVKTTGQGADISMMADCMAHMKAISRAGEKNNIVLNVCLDIDMSFRPFRGLHLGVRRSPIRNKHQVLDLLNRAGDLKGIRIKGIMGYEAQIASLNDNYPGAKLKNKILRTFKGWSSKELSRRRGEIVRAAVDAGLDIDFVNGGGSGSLMSTGKDESVTEVTAGSAFFAPGLFRYFHDVEFKPAAFFGLQVARLPEKGMITCQGGGYIGSGEVSETRLPWPMMPPGLTFLPMEGAGEVQTPLKFPKNAPGLKIGEPVFFQHAKAGELCERFNELCLVHSGKIINTVLTYRGMGKAFL